MNTKNFALSRRDIIKIAALVLFLPFVAILVLVKLNPLTLMEGAGNTTTWIGFSGSYAGGIISCTISILILNRNLLQSSTMNYDLRVIQLNTIEYNRQREWLSGLKLRLSENLKAIDLYVLNTVVSCLALKNYTYAKGLLTEVNKQLEYQVVMSSFYFMSSPLSEEEEQYMQITKRIHLEYSSLVKDLLFYIPLAESLKEGNKLVYEELIDYTMTQYDYLKEQHTSQYEVKGNVTSRILELGPEANIPHELDKIIEMRLTMRTNLYQLKSELSAATHRLMDYEEKKVNMILSKG